MSYIKETYLRRQPGDRWSQPAFPVALRPAPGCQPQPDRAMPGAQRLVEIAERLAGNASRCDRAALRTAYARAAEQLQAGCQAQLVRGDLYVPSASEPGRTYRVSGAGCSCPAGRRGGVGCWHAALAECVRVAWDEDADHDAAPLPFEPTVGELRAAALAEASL